MIALEGLKDWSVDRARKGSFAGADVMLTH